MAGAGMEATPRVGMIVQFRVVRTTRRDCRCFPQEIVPEEVAVRHQKCVKVLARTGQIVGIYGMPYGADYRLDGFSREGK